MSDSPNPQEILDSSKESEEAEGQESAQTGSSIDEAISEQLLKTKIEETPERTTPPKSAPFQGNSGGFASTGGFGRMQGTPSVAEGSSSGSSAGVSITGTKKTVHAYEGQTFVARPGYVSPNLGQTTEVYSNHYGLILERDTILFTVYNLEVYETPSGAPPQQGNRPPPRGGQRGAKQLTKRENVSPLFWNLVQCYPEVFLTDTFIVNKEKIPKNLVFNDVNMLYVLGTNGLPNMEAGQRTFVLNKEEGRRQKRYEMTLKNTGVQSASLTERALKEQRDNVICVYDLVLSQRIRCGLHKDKDRFETYKNNSFLIPQIDWHQEHPPSTHECINLGHGLCAWSALHAAVKTNLQYSKNVLLNIDLSYSVFYKSSNNLLRHCFEILERTRGAKFNWEEVRRMCANRGTKRFLEEKLKGLSVKPTYQQRAKRLEIYEISQPDITAKTYMLDMPNGVSMSVEEYFYQQYNIRLDFPHLPMARVQKQKKNYIPLELLQLSELPQKFKGQPAEEQLAYFIRETALKPIERKALIERLAGCATDDNFQEGYGALSEQDEIMKAWGCRVEKKMLKIEARFLPRPQLEFPIERHSNQTEIFEAPEAGVWAVADPKCNGIRTALVPPPPTAWMLVIVDPLKSTTQIRPANFKFLMEVVHAFGITVYSGENPVSVYEWDFDNATGGDPAQDLTVAIEDFKAQCKAEEEKAHAEGKLDKDLPLLPVALFVFPRRSPETYRVSKYICEVKVGVHHQGILARNLDRCNGNVLSSTTAHNMFFKINAKLGGTHYRIPPNGLHKNWNKVVDRKEPTLFVGVDVTHSGSKDQQKRDEARRATQKGFNNKGQVAAHSVASVVANIDIDCTQYRMSTRIQKKDEERLVNLTDELFARIAEFVETSGCRPKHIVIYRDGVSETEFKRTFYEEKKAYDHALERLDSTGEYKPTLTYIVTSKRHHTRFFPNFPRDTTPEAQNLRPGLLVEKEVTTKDYFDFYLLSHNGPLSTSRPTHYYVLWDEWKPSAAFWQTVTYVLCHLYVRTPKSVSLPAPVYYAHLAAKRAADWLKAYELNYMHADMKERDCNEDTLYIKKSAATKPILSGMLFC